MYYDEVLSASRDDINKISDSDITPEMSNDAIGHIAWVFDAPSGPTGRAVLGGFCSNGWLKKVSVTRGPSRYNAIIETAEVCRNCL